MNILESLYNKVIENGDITKEEAVELYSQSLEPLCTKADKIRQHFCKNIFDVCTIVNAKSGQCNENCKFCAQSAHNKTAIDAYSLLSDDEIVECNVGSKENIWCASCSKCLFYKSGT